MHPPCETRLLHATCVEFSRLGTNVEVCVVVVECLVVLRFMFWGAAVGSVVGLVFSVAATGATLLEGDSRKEFSIGVRLDFKLWGGFLGA